MVEKIIPVWQNKKEIRKQILLHRDQMSQEEQARATLLLTERVIGHQWFYLSEIILCFMSFGSEANTRFIIEEALNKKKQVYLPKIIENKMEFYRIQNMEDLQPGVMNILEPCEDSEKYRYQEEKCEKTLLIMPGVAFDKENNRLGYGKGYYDKFLEHKTGLHTRSIGIGYKCQGVDNIPTEKTDVKPYQIILM